MREQNDPSKFSEVPPPCGPGKPGEPPQHRRNNTSRNRPNIDGRLSDDRTHIDPVEVEPVADKAARQAPGSDDGNNDLT